MPNDQFPILGTSVPPMLGRENLMKRTTTALTKDVPDHLQVVGPRFSGKTVFLHELANILRKNKSSYLAVLVWDLGHQTPRTDELFMQGLARELFVALKSSHADYVEHIKSPQDNLYENISELLDLLKEEGVKILVIMDGFDKPLSNGQLTRNLWDQLRDLALKPSLRLITASRRTLRDLIRHPDAKTSDFWNIFSPNPVRLGCFDENDLKSVLLKMPAYHLANGAKTELWNASNGFPIIMLDILNAVKEVSTIGTVSAEEMKAACTNVYPIVRDKLDALWSDCPSSCQELVTRILDEGQVSRVGVAVADIDTMLELGFAQCLSNKLQRPSQLLERYLQEQPHEGNAIVRLFGTEDAYLKNLKGVMERRINQLGGIDPTLKHYLERCIGDMPSQPKVFLSNVRGICSESLEAIWKAEIPNRRIPSEWMTIWKHNDERGVDEWRTTFPQGGQRLRLLNLMTGTEKSVKCAKYTTKGTYVLMNALYGFGDFGQHQEGAPVAPGTAYAALHLCIELVCALTHELPNDS